MIKPRISKGFSGNLLPVNVSLCMIVKNEADSLANCLKSVEGIVDEIIVIDTGSTDKTIQIAQKSGAKIYKFDWCDDFAAARNYSLQHARGEWILILDGDEVLNQEIVPVLRRVVDDPNCLAVNIVRLEIGTRRSPYSIISRLFRRHPDIYFTGFYHELIDESVMRVLDADSRWQVVAVPQVGIYHYGYQEQEINKKQKFDLAQRLMLKHLQQYPDDVYMHSKLGALQIENGEFEMGLNLLKKGLEILTNIHNNPMDQNIAIAMTVKSGNMGAAPRSDTHSYISNQTLFELNYHLGIAYSRVDSKLTSWEAAKRYYQIALAVDVPDVVKLPVFNNLGNLLQAQEDHLGAIAQYQKVVEIAPDFAIGYYNLGIAYKSTGNYLQAIAAYARAVKINPEYAEAYQNLAIALFQTAQTQAAITAFKQAIKYHRLQQNFEMAQELSLMMQELGLV